MKRTIDINILGIGLSVKTEQNEEEVKRIEEYVNNKILEIVNTDKTVDTLYLITLAALNIASDYFNVVKERSEIEQCFEKKVERLIDFVDSNI
ncbi:MAG: cell division protein ZapA [Thermodesulfobacteriota bacterium]|nr:cell division protein ZapA [Thermodesulfobacteriota bacterium]